jgi:hypothetical protein
MISPWRTDRSEVGMWREVTADERRSVIVVANANFIVWVERFVVSLVVINDLFVR